MAIRDVLLPEFDLEAAKTRTLLERVPDSRLDWRPHQKSSSLNELATHLAGIARWLDPLLNSTSFDLASVEPVRPLGSSTAAILTMFDEAAATGRSLIASKTDAELLARWSLKRNGQEMFSVPRLTAVRRFIMNHTIHHRGQLSVYLRLNGIPIPPIYGPSADEGDV